MDDNLQIRIYDWLSTKLEQAESMKSRAMRLHNQQKTDYSQGQFNYAKNLCASIKWLRSQIPNSFRDVPVLGIVDTAILEEAGKIVLGMEH